MSKVAVLECGDYNIENVTNKLTEGFRLLGGLEAFIQPGMQVLLKINLIGPKGPETGAVTHCEFVRALTRMLLSHGCTVWIGDSAGGAIAGIAPTERGMEVSGMKKVALEEGAEIKNFEKTGIVEINTPDGIMEKIYLAKPVFEADFVINLPKFKTHSSAIFTGAVKNVFGMIPGLRKAEYHKIAPNPKEFGQVLLDIHKSVKIGLHIMDGIIAMEGEGPTAGKAYPAKKILISTDPIALDAVAAAMVGIGLDDMPILHAYASSGIGEANIDKIMIVGDYSKPPKLKGFTLPKRFGSTKHRSGKALSTVISFFKARPSIDLRLCRQCNTCVESCPVQAIDRKSKSIDYEKCIECLCCHELCMYKAVKLKNDNLMASIIKKLIMR